MVFSFRDIFNEWASKSKELENSQNQRPILQASRSLGWHSQNRVYSTQESFEHHSDASVSDEPFSDSKNQAQRISTSSADFSEEIDLTRNSVAELKIAEQQRKIYNALATAAAPQPSAGMDTSRFGF